MVVESLTEITSEDDLEEMSDQSMSDVDGGNTSHNCGIFYKE